jgi:hypothetical protein
MRFILALVVTLVVPAGVAWAQNDPDVDPAKVDHAINQGAQWLLRQTNLAQEFEHAGRTQGRPKQSTLELAILTLVHAGLTEENPKLKELIEIMLNRPLESTYGTSIQAMALQKLDPVKYQTRLAQCAQFLVDNQAENGQWCYGAPTEYPEWPETPVNVTESAVKSKKPEAPAFKKKIFVRRNPDFAKRPPSGDNSNSQYAALGIRACMEAGVIIDREALELARKWWIESQCSDGGWYYQKGDGFSRERGTQVEKKDPPARNARDAWGSMTVGAVGALCIYNHLLSRDYKNDPSVLGGVDWIARQFTVTENPKKDRWYLYYLYGLERAGILYGTVKFGTHKWYAEGANHLLQTQKPDGAWEGGQSERGGTIADTCFAILFLKRATAPLIHSGDTKKK